MWTFLVTFSRDLLANGGLVRYVSSPTLTTAFNTSMLLSPILAPFIGWLADVRLGRYKVIICIFMGVFVSNTLFTVSMITEESVGDILSCIAAVLSGFVQSGFTVAMLPFLCDQIIGANAEELSAIVYWYCWVKNVAFAINTIITSYPISLAISTQILVIALPCVAVPVMIIVSDCLCQQWLDKTHKVTNPIKLVVKVLNYARKHKYPERRSAFTYIDEEHPSRMDFGKEKFGGPFTEEEVEDVKTVLRLLPIVICVIISFGGPHINLRLDALDDQFGNSVLNDAVGDTCWLPPLLLVPLFQYLLYPLFHKWVPSMLKRIGAGLFMQLVATVITEVEIKGYQYTASGNLTEYLTCTTITIPVTELPWYWRVFPLLMYCFGRALLFIVLLEFAIAQSPEKMKGFVLGIYLLFDGISGCIGEIMEIWSNTLCYTIPAIAYLTVLFLLFLFLSNRYGLRERNREINIQAIVEEHYERYIDQEQEYRREHPQYDNFDSTTCILDSES